MKKTFFFFVAIFVFATSLFAQKGYEAKFSQPGSNEYQVTFTVTDWNLTNVVYDGVSFKKLVFSSSAVTQEVGWAELPFISASIQLPARKNVDLNVTYTEFTDYQLDFPLVPSRGVIYRNQDPNTIPYQIAPESVMDKFYPGHLAKAEEPYIIRDVRGTSVRVFPFQYNSATQTLRVYTKMEVLLTENNEPATNPLLVDNPNPIREARGMYKSLFINYQEPRIPLFMADHGDILVITTARDEAAIQPYIDWKKQKGYNVAKEVVATGTNVKSLIQQKYNANNNLMYVLLVGDWADIKCEEYTGAPTDPMLGDVVGVATQYRPDISIGRMSANTPEHVTTQVNKTIQYEKNPNMEAAWYSAFAGLGSNDGSGGDDGEKDHTHVMNIYDYRLVPKYSYNQHKGFYDYNGTASASALTTAINTGLSTIAYCGHGSNTAWSTTGFSNTNVNALTNGTKLPFIISVACVNGAFHTASDCFAEAWAKKENGGAAVSWMSTINQPWNPPMRGQDYFYDVLIGGYNYTTQPGNGISTEELRTHWGAIAVNAANLMLSEVSNSDDIETVRTWCTFGDPNLQLRTKQPAVLASSSEMMIVGTPYETTITANGNAVKDALVCISQNGVYKSAFTDAAGQVTITNEFTPGEVLLVVTAFNTNTIYKNIMCIAPSGPYVINEGYSVVGAEKLTYISTNQEIEVTLKNVGVAATSGALTATITCSDPQLTINTGTAQVTSVIAPDGATTVKFKVTISNDIEDGKTFPLDLTVASGSADPWISKVILKAFAPEFKLSKVLIDGVENGKLPKGNLAKITCVVENKGGADAFDVKGELEINNPYLTIACEDGKKRNSENLPAGETMNLDFYVIVSPNIPSGYDVNMSLSLTAQYGRSFNTSFKATSTVPVLGNACSSGNQDCGSNDKFTSVKILNGTTVLLSNTNGDCASGGYQNYTNMVVSLEPGQTYTIKVTCGYGSQQIGGWFDLNGNNTFETTEKLITMNGGTTETSSTFTIPATATAGEYRFRLVAKWSSAPAACSNSSYGQTHDYTFSIPNTLPQVQNVNAALDGDNINVTWQAPATGTPNGYNIYRNGNKLNGATPLTALTYTEENVVEGIYVYNVTAVYESNKESYATMSNVVCNFLPCEMPTAFSVVAEGKTATITWNVPANLNGVVLLGYDIYRDGDKINANPISALVYKDENLAVGTYTYQVAAVYEHCEAKSAGESITILPQYCEAPVNLAVTVDEFTVHLTWDEPLNIDGVLLGYYIYRDDALIELAQPITEKEYFDENLVDGTYTYQVSAVYNHCESPKTDGKSITVGINELQTSSFNIYPNPTTGEFSITNYELRITNIEVFDIYGKKQDVEFNSYGLTVLRSYGLSNLPSGVYFVKIYAEESQIAIKKLIINH